MRLSLDYYLQQTKDGAYFIPVGQALCDHKKAFSLSEEGAFVARKLRDDISFENLYESVQEKISREELQDFLEFLQQKNLLEKDVFCETKSHSDEEILFGIGPLVMHYEGPEDLIHEFMKAFRVGGEVHGHDFEENLQGGSQGDFFFRVQMGDPEQFLRGRILHRNKDVLVMENETHYIVLYLQFHHIREMIISKSDFHTVAYSDTAVNLPAAEGDTREELFRAMRAACLLKAQSMGAFCMHSASLLYEGKALVFSGPSGMGKSTHTAFWREAFSTEDINGDLNLLGQTPEGKYVVYGIPWCGTSERYRTGTYPLGAIVLLGQGPENVMEEVSESTLAVGQRFITPAWNADLSRQNYAFAEKVAKEVPLIHATCRKNVDAAYAVRDYLKRENVL